jgi:hypothetical protein
MAASASMVNGLGIGIHRMNLLGHHQPSDG